MISTRPKLCPLQSFFPIGYLFKCLCFFPLLIFNSSTAAPHNAKPNLLFIIVDDLNHLPLQPAGRPLIATPNMDALAKQGLNFTNAHCNVALCESSRTSLFYGLYPQTTGVYWFESWKKRASMQNKVAMTTHLKANGVKVYGTGKIYHKKDHVEDFERFGVATNYGPHPVNGIVKYMGHHSNMEHNFKTFSDKISLNSSTWDFLKWEQTFGPLEELPDWSHLPEGKKGWTLYGKPWHLRQGHNRDQLPDEDCVDFTRTVLQEEHKSPFAIFCGLVRTHTPLYAPKAYFDRFPLESITLPKVKSNDLEDCAEILSQKEHYGFLRQQYLKLNQNDDLYRKWVQAYLACLSFVDDQIGRIMDDLAQSPYADNTIVILTSDHGFHMGEKDFLYKHSLWEESTRVPLIIRPSNTMKSSRAETCDHPVSLVDLYPTVVDLMELPKVPNQRSPALDGFSLKPFLENPRTTEWQGPKAAITALSGMDHMMDGKAIGAPYPHFAIRSKDFRYILCSNGEEELYHHGKDPLEHENLAHSPEYKSIKEELKHQLIELREGKGWEEMETIWSHNGTLNLGSLSPSEFDFHLSPQKKVLGHIDLKTQQHHWLSHPVKTMDAQHWRMRFDGQRVEVWIDGVCLLSTKDEEIIRGKLSLFSKQSFRIEGFKYRKL